MKSGGLELKGVMHYSATNISMFRFPLSVIIDYRGFRISAISLLPIRKSTICYGSSDGGETIHNDDPAIEQEMKKAAKYLNLKEHFVGSYQGGQALYSVGDLEVHKGDDSRVYLIDFARAFPPEG